MIEAQPIFVIFLFVSSFFPANFVLFLFDLWMTSPRANFLCKLIGLIIQWKRVLMRIVYSWLLLTFANKHHFAYRRKQRLLPNVKGCYVGGSPSHLRKILSCPMRDLANASMVQHVEALSGQGLPETHLRGLASRSTDAPWHCYLRPPISEKL